MGRIKQLHYWVGFVLLLTGCGSVPLQDLGRTGLLQDFEDARMRGILAPAIANQWIWPLSEVRFTSYYGHRGRRFHHGVDLGSPKGASVMAIGSGKVSFQGWMRGYGRIVVVTHEPGVQSIYAHLSKALVKRGQVVKKGQVIAKTGKTGRTSGPHLHLEIRKDGKSIDPVRVLPPAFQVEDQLADEQQFHGSHS